jgi:hypothetical protein
MRRYRKMGGAGKRSKVPQYRPPERPYQPYQQPPKTKTKQARRRKRR